MQGLATMRLAQVAIEKKNNIYEGHMPSRLTINSILKDFVKKGET
jgi:hypothetical protein